MTQDMLPHTSSFMSASSSYTPPIPAALQAAAAAARAAAASQGQAQKHQTFRSIHSPADTYKEIDAENDPTYKPVSPMVIKHTIHTLSTH